jgi:hypothetical protein
VMRQPCYLRDLWMGWSIMGKLHPSAVACASRGEADESLAGSLMMALVFSAAH